MEAPVLAALPNEPTFLRLVLGMSPEDAAQAKFGYLLGHGLHLLGHYLQGSMQWVDSARREEDGGMPFFTSLWHALEDARLENRLIERWPGSQRALDSRLPPELGGMFTRLMNSTRQVELGIYLHGRGIEGMQFSESVREAFGEIEQDIRAGASGSRWAWSGGGTLRVIQAGHRAKPGRGGRAGRSLR